MRSLKIAVGIDFLGGNIEYIPKEDGLFILE